MLRSAFVRTCFRKLGILRSVVLLTLVAMAFSLLVTFVAALVDGTFYSRSFIFAIIVPGIVGPIMSSIFVIIIFQLDNAEEELQKLATTDDLTGVCNRRHFLELAGREIARACRLGNFFSSIILDVDNFKRINDGNGHAAGDSVLKEVAATCLRHCRKIDTFARYGGDEFIFLLPECGLEEAVAFAERIRTAVAEIHVDYPSHSIRITASLGVQTFEGADESLESLLIRTDQAMYDAKDSGKNRVSTTTISIT